VVVGDTVTLCDLCELRGFEPETERKLAKLAVTSSPQPGGRRIVHLEMIRSALEAAGINMACTTLRGSTRCTVSRPSLPESPTTFHRRVAGATQSSGPVHPTLGSATSPPVTTAESAVPHEQTDPAAHTLRQHIIDWLGAELSRYGGRVEVEFGQGTAAALDLTSPPYEFALRRKNRAEIGVVHLEVDIKSDGNVRQTTRVVCNVSYFAPVVVARRPVNRSMTIRETDVQQMEMKFTSLDRLSVSDPSLVIGRRAKRFVPVGGVIRGRDLEEVPLVTRNQLVRLVASVGGVRVETAGKAVGAGAMGDVITVRSLDGLRREFEAVITGPGETMVGRPGRHSLASNMSVSGGG